MVTVMHRYKISELPAYEINVTTTRIHDCLAQFDDHVTCLLNFVASSHSCNAVSGIISFLRREKSSSQFMAHFPHCFLPPDPLILLSMSSSPTFPTSLPLFSRLSLSTGGTSRIEKSNETLLTTYPNANINARYQKRHRTFFLHWRPDHADANVSDHTTPNLCVCAR